MAIEEEFSIEIPDKEADAIHSGKFLSLFAWRIFCRTCMRTVANISCFPHNSGQGR